MERIVVLTGDSDRDDNLIRCLKMLFPECNIEVHSNQPLNDDNPNSTVDPSGNYVLDEKLDKYMSFL